MIRLAAWIAGAAVTAIVVATITIFGLDYYEPGFGRARSLQVSLVVGLAFIAVGGLSYVVTSRLASLLHTAWEAVLAGAAFQLCLTATIEGIKHGVPALNSFVTAAILAVVLGSASTVLYSRRVA